MKHTTFYCENCAKPVPLDAEECPHCGSRFTAVQCPQCSYIGKAKLFANGCPECGFLAPDGEPGPKFHVTYADEALEEPSAGGAASSGEELKPIPAYRRSTSRLPGWFYSLASVLLLALLIGLLFLIFRMH